MPPYNEQFPAGSRARVKSRQFLERFQREWKYHHPVSDEQLDSAGFTDTVKGAAFYHGGDVLYTLSNTSGVWHEECLEAAAETQQIRIHADFNGLFGELLCLSHKETASAQTGRTWLFMRV